MAAVAREMDKCNGKTPEDIILDFVVMSVRSDHIFLYEVRSIFFFGFDLSACTGIRRASEFTVCV